MMTRPELSTGQTCRILRISEARLADLDRRGRITPKPQVVAGRRLWTEAQVRRAAELLGVLTPEVEASIQAAFSSEEVARG